MAEIRILNRNTTRIDEYRKKLLEMRETYSAAIAEVSKTDREVWAKIHSITDYARQYRLDGQPAAAHYLLGMITCKLEELLSQYNSVIYYENLREQLRALEDEE